MKTRKFHGNEMQAVMTQIKDEIGDEAVIISMEEKKGMIEIEVGIESQDITLQQPDPLDLRLRAESPETLPKATKKQQSKTASHLEEILLRQGVQYRYANEIVQRGLAGAEVGLSADRYIAQGIESSLNFNSIMPFESKVVAFVGATGVGKTTTIAKLAARLRMHFNLSIALISADTYRVGAGYHLHTYASLLNMPCRAVDPTCSQTAKQVRDSVEAFEDFDLIMIDTAGCGPRDQGRVTELAEDLSQVPDAERILVLPAPSNDFDLHAAASAFDVVGYNRLALTKMDESGFMGPILNTIYELARPIAFMTTGQRVPEDIEPASARRLGWMLTRMMH